MNYNFEAFTGAGSKIDERITVTKIGSFGILSGFTKKRLKSILPKYVELFYDSEKRAVALHFSDEKQHSRSFAVVNTGGGGSVSARSFFKTYDIDPVAVSGKYEVQEIEDPQLGKLFVIQLS
ncbi:MAG: hypothetical protein WC654_00255 [Patescibacteria group bacterium]